MHASACFKFDSSFRIGCRRTSISDTCNGGDAGNGRPTPPSFWSSLPFIQFAKAGQISPSFNHAIVVRQQQEGRACTTTTTIQKHNQSGRNRRSHRRPRRFSSGSRRMVHSPPCGPIGLAGVVTCWFLNCRRLPSSHVRRGLCSRDPSHFCPPLCFCASYLLDHKTTIF